MSGQSLTGGEIVLADLPGARILLIGTGTHAPGSTLPDVPAVVDTLSDLRSALVTFCGFADDAVRIVADPPHAYDIGEAVAEAADEASSLLMLYYVGHGLVSHDGALHLAAQSSEGFRPDRRVSRVTVTAAPYVQLRDLILDSGASARVVVLDCCFSGRALDGLASRGDEVANVAQLAGGFVLTSAGGEEIAFAPEGARHTAFTGELIRLLREGDPDGPAWLSFQHIYRQLSTALPAAGYPRPRQRSNGPIADMVLAPNRAFRSAAFHQTPPRPSQGGVARIDVCPYVGLAAFHEADAAWFRGRRSMTTRLVRMVSERLDDPRPLLVTGASGSGKSSLLRAGLVPALTRGDLPVAGSSTWPRLVITPTDHPIRELASGISDAIGAASEHTADAPLATDPLGTCASREPAEFAHLVQRGLSGTAPMRLVLVVDQFEELFTQCDDEVERLAFIRALVALSSGENGMPAALVVLGLRADFYARCTAYPELAATLEGHQLVVGAMTLSQVREAIEAPARSVRLAVEPGLVEVLLADLGARQNNPSDADGEAGSYEPGRLPFLAHALRETWLNRRADALTVEAYQQTGGIHKALASSADDVLAHFDPHGQEIARRLFLGLVRISEGNDDVRRRVRRADLLTDTGEPELAALILGAFAADTARLVTIDHDTVEITHEALLRAWPTLQAWIDNDRAGLLVRQQIIDAAHDWERVDRDPAALYAGTRLALAQQWAQTERRNELPANAVEFLDQSRRQEEEHRRRDLAEQAAAKLRARRNKAVAVVLGILLVVALAGGGIAALQWRRADAQEQLARQEQRLADTARDAAIAQQRAATARTLIIEAESLRPTDPVTALRLGVAALVLSSEPQARASLQSTLAAPRPIGRIDNVSKYLYDIDFSADKRTLATVADGIIELWNVANWTSPKQMSTIKVTSENPISEALSPDGHSLAVAADAGSGGIWDISVPGRPQRQATFATEVQSVAFSPDGKLLATGGAGLWNMTDARKPQRAGALTEDASAVAVSPDNRTAATGEVGGELKLWDVSNPQRARRIATTTQHHAPIYELVFDSTGRFLISHAILEGINEVWLWDIGTARKPKRLAELDPYALSAGFSPDGRLITNNADNTATIWRLDDPAKLHRTATFGSQISGAKFSPDGRSLATFTTGGDIQFWDTSPLAAISADPLREACTAAHGGLTAEQWRDHVTGLPYVKTCEA